MASTYPGTLDSFATNKANATATTTDHPAHHNDLADAVNKIEAELGADPAGASATVVARLAAMDTAIAGAGGGDLVYVGEPGVVSVASTSDVTVFSQNVTGLSTASQIAVDCWGLILLNGTGGAQVLTWTLDYDAAFDMEYAMNSGNLTGISFRFHSFLTITATNDAKMFNQVSYNNQSGPGTMAGSTAFATGYDTSTQDLTGTTAVQLFCRSSSATAPQTVAIYGLTIRKY